MRSKYIDEKVGVLYIFGEYPKTGNVDVVSPDKDVFINISKELAEQICEANVTYRSILYKILSDA